MRQHSSHHRSRRGLTWESVLAIIAVIATTVFAGYRYYSRPDRPQQQTDRRYIPNLPPPASPLLSGKERLERLLLAIDRRDYTGVEQYARSIFEDRSDANLDPVIQGLQDPVLRAAEDGDTQLLNALIVARPAFGGQDSEGRRAIHIAALNDNGDTIRWLAANVDADPDDPVAGARLTALHLAAASGTADAVRALVEVGADLQSLTATGLTPLHYAVERGSAVGVRALIDAADRSQVLLALQFQSAEGETPLHTAARLGNDAIAKMLVEAGASLSATDAEGLIPSQTAFSYGHEHLSELLR